MIRIILSFIVLATSITVSAQKPQSHVSLKDMTFIRQSFARNFYNTSKVMSQINMEGTNLFLPNSANLIIEKRSSNLPSFKQQGRKLYIASTQANSVATIRVGSFHPYLCYEARFGELHTNDSVGIEFYPNNNQGEIIRTFIHDGKVCTTTSIHGVTLLLAEKQTPPAQEIELRIQYTGMRFHVFRIYEDGRAELLYSVEKDMRAIESSTTHSFGIYAAPATTNTITLLKAQSLLTCGTGQADPQIVQTTDGQPLIRDGRLYISFTTRGFERIFDSYQGMYSIDLASYELKLEGALFFGKGDGIMYGFHATKVVYDPEKKEYLVITTTHEDTHTLAYSSTQADILHGIHYLECIELDFPHNYTRNHKFNTEDPDFFYDAEAKKWRLAYCALKDNSYVTYLCESENWNGPYTQIAESVHNNNTGIRITTVGGHRYVLSGGTDTTFYIYDYPSLNYLGTFKQQYANGGFRGWPTIVPIPYGNYERYLWITFDRGAQTGRYSYGTLYFYLGDKMWRKE